MKARSTRHKNITRVDQVSKNTHGYNVRIRWKGKMYSKFFSDNVCGDRLAALHDAIVWRDETEQEIGKPRTNRLVIGSSTRNKTGVIGVRKRKRGNTEVYEATWIDETGKVGRTSYSIARHGERRAFSLAVKARNDHERRRQRAPLEREERAKAAPKQIERQVGSTQEQERLEETQDLPAWPELHDLLKRRPGGLDGGRGNASSSML